MEKVLRTGTDPANAASCCYQHGPKIISDLLPSKPTYVLQPGWSIALGRLMYIFKFLDLTAPFLFSRGKDHSGVWSADFVAEHKFMCLKHSKAKLKPWSLKQRKVCCRAMPGDGWLMSPKPWTPQRVSGKHFDRQGEEGAWLVVETFMLESFVLAASHVVRSWCSYKPLTRQMLCSVLQLCLYMNGLLKIGQWALLCISGYKQHSFNERCRVSMTKQRQGPQG